MTAPEERLRQFLNARGPGWGAPIHYFESVGSTNDFLKERAKEGAPEWTVAMARRQGSGRGRHGHSWVSPEGNLFLSVLLRPSSSAPWTLVPLLAGVAVAEAVAELGLTARLKWPNDVLIGDRKVAGILVDASSGSRSLESMVAGIGVNVAVSPGSVAPDLALTATSLHAEGAEHVDAIAVAAAVLGRLAVWYPAFAREGGRALVSAWRSHSLPWWGRAVEARSGGAIVRGIARDVDDTGALVLELPDGRRAALHSAEVREVRSDPPAH